jgi:hypothetical protein
MPPDERRLERETTEKERGRERERILEEYVVGVVEAMHECCLDTHGVGMWKLLTSNSPFTYLIVNFNL